MRIALLLLLAGNSCFAADLDQITIDLHRPRWSLTSYPAAQAKPANDCSMDLRGEFPKFICNDPGLRATYEYEFDLPIEMTQAAALALCRGILRRAGVTPDIGSNGSSNGSRGKTH